MSLDSEVQALAKATADQVTASQELTQEVAGKMGEIDEKLENKMNEFDEYLEDQNPTFNKVKIKSVLSGLATVAKFDLAPGESRVVLKNSSAYTAASGILTFHLNHGNNGVLMKCVSFSGYGMTESELGGTTSNFINISLVRSDEVGGEHLSPGQCELLVNAPAENAITVGVSMNFVNISAVGVSVSSEILS